MLRTHMMKMNHNDIINLLTEWKEIVDVAHSEHTIRDEAKSKIDEIIEEFRKPLNLCNRKKVENLMNDLQKVSGISQYVKNAMQLVLEACDHK
jgi:hypothetical protein